MWVQIIGHVTYLLIALSYTLRDIVWLRLVAVMASCTSIVFNVVAPQSPLWLVINWNIVFLVVNLLELFRIRCQRRQRALTDEEARLAATIFQNLRLHDASRLMRAASWENVEAGATLVKSTEPLSILRLVVQGRLQIRMPNGKLHFRDANTFVGEVSFVTGQPASATVLAETNLRCLCWSFETLHVEMARSAQVAIDLQRILCADLGDKLRNPSCQNRESELVFV